MSTSTSRPDPRSPVAGEARSSGAPTTDRRVVIAVPTYRRPDDLARLVPDLFDQIDALHRDRAGYTATVLVIDNDPDGSAELTCAGFEHPGLCYVREATPGIAAVRNRALDEARTADVLVMIDDDEQPEPQWLDALLATWDSHRAALVAGRVTAEYEGQLDPWIAAGDFFLRRNLPTGTVIHTAAAGNLLLDVQQVRDLGMRFDENIGLGGGEDTLFSRQLHARGGQLVWCNESLVVDRVPLSRMTRRWVLKRAWGHGNVLARTELKLASGRGARFGIRARRSVGGAGRVILGGCRFVVGVALRSQRHQARGLRALMRGAGMVSAVTGYVHQEYARNGRGGA